MGLSQTIVFYLVIGASVATATFLSAETRSKWECAYRLLSAWLFWPMYLPILLSRQSQTGETIESESSTASPLDDISVAINQVEAELAEAVSSLDGWAEGVLAHEESRFGELRSAWRMQAERIRELDRLLTHPDYMRCDESGHRAADDVQSNEQGKPYRASQSEQSRRENIAKLYQVRRRMHDDLMGTLAWVRELVTMIHLAKFTGAPASRAEELVSQIAAAVEGLSEVSSWQTETAMVEA
ncbi:MAG: hypothetical protein ACKVT0_12655 [Planctomycetaceae bacterium]